MSPKEKQLHEELNKIIGPFVKGFSIEFIRKHDDNYNRYKFSIEPINGGPVVSIEPIIRDLPMTEKDEYRHAAFNMIETFFCDNYWEGGTVVL